jgi:hypothetical protein
MRELEELHQRVTQLRQPEAEALLNLPGGAHALSFNIPVLAEELSQCPEAAAPLALDVAAGQFA